MRVASARIADVSAKGGRPENQGEYPLTTTGVVVAGTETKARGLLIIVVVGAEATKAAAATERHIGRVRSVARALMSSRLAMRAVWSRGRGWNRKNRGCGWVRSVQPWHS